MTDTRRFAPFPLLLIGLAVIIAMTLIPRAAQAQSQTLDQNAAVWSADMLVVEYTEISIGAASADLFSNVGGTGNLQIKSLWSYVPDSDLRLAFTDGVPNADDMTLKVGDLELEFPPWSSENSSFKWTGVDVDWKDGDTVAVSIVRTSTLTEPEGNTQATGGPTITGTPQVDQTLTADTSSITDEDGLEAGSYEYQWIRSDNGTDTDIAGATEATYTLIFADQGKTIKVKVTFTDDAENDETLTGEATRIVTAAPNRTATGDPTISGTPQVNRTLTAGTAAISDADGLDGVSYEYQWLADGTDIGNATEATYTPSKEEVGKTIKVRVSFTDDRNNEESRTSAATSAVLATVPGQPQSLTVTAGDNIQELDGSWQAPSSNGGSDVTGYKVQWKESTDSWDTEADVSEATVTGTTHTITDLTGGVEYAVRVLATNIAGDGQPSAEVTSTPAGGVSQQQVVEPANSVPNGLPTISGTPQVEQTLTADTSDIDDADGLSNVSYEYQWLAGGLEISGAASSSYQLTSSEQGQTIQVRVSFTDDADNQEILTSEATVAVAAKPNNDATGAPTILGTAQASETLWVETSKISDVDGIDNAVFEYQWISTDGTTDTDITGGARSEYYIIKPWDLGKYIRVRVSFTDDAGNAEALTSIATTAVEASPNQIPTGTVYLSGMAEVGQELTTSTGSIYDANGLRYGRFSYQWIRNDGTTDVDIQGATNPGYVLTDADEGKTIRVRLSFTDDGGNPETLTSSATTTVAARPSASDLGEPTDLTVGWSQGQEKGLELQWTAPEGAVTSYQILRLEIPTRLDWSQPYDYGCTPLMRVHVNDTGSDATTYTDTDVGEGASYSYSVRAINEDGVGRKSSSPRDVQYRPHGYWPSGLPGSPWRAPDNLSSSQIKNGIGLTWDAPEGEVTGYQILRRAPEQCEYGYRVYVENTNSTDTHWADRNVVAGTRYEYHVKAVNDVGAGRLDTRVFTSLRPTALVIGPEPNNEATGTPTITGTAQVGQTLTADPSGIADADGMHWARFSYQWLSGEDTEIEGATSSTYTLRASDANKVIKVRVDVMDDSGYEESLTSAATAPVSPNVSATGAPSITGTVEVGETLTADTSGIADPDGLDNVSYRYQWIRSDGTDDWEVDGATGSTYAVTPADVDKAIKLRVNFTDDKGSVESLTSPATAVVPIEVSLAFSIEGATVTCDSKECDDPPSVDQGASDEIEVEIEIVRSANSQLYKFDFHINQSWDSFGGYGPVEANDLCLGPGLADSATMEVTPDDGDGNFTYTDEGTIFRLCPAGIYHLSVRWYRYNYEDQEYEDAGVFGRFFFINGNDEEDTSIEQVEAIYASYPDTPVSHEEVQIEGTKLSTRLNRTLTTFALSIDGLVPNTDTETTDYVVRVQVVGNDAYSGSYGPTVPWCHVGNVGYSYLLKTVPEDGRWEMDAHVKGSCLEHWWPDRLQVELFDGPDLTEYSKPIVFDGSQIVSYTGEPLYPEYGTHEFIAGKYISLGSLSNTAPTGAPVISGTPQAGETLTADTSPIDDADGLTNVSYEYQWIAGGTDIAGATGSTYELTSSEQGKTIQVRVTFTDDADNEETLTSMATAAVAAAPVPLTVSVTVSAPDSHDGASEFTFEIEFSEEFGISYRTLKSHAFNVTGGSVKRAQRTDKPSNIPWRITIKPQGNGDVTIVLPVTTDCNADGAICTGDGRKLSNSLSFTVPGPGQ